MLWCLFKGHDFREVERFRLGDTSAPYPAVDEWRVIERCVRCDSERRRFAGFVMSNDPEAET